MQRHLGPLHPPGRAGPGGPGNGHGGGPARSRSRPVAIGAEGRPAAATFLAERAAPLALVAGAVAFGLVELRSELTLVAYTNDSSAHAEMVRFATAQLRAGHLPLRSWFPYLGLGSPQFLHYQSLGAMLCGLAGLAVGPDRAFAWSLYLVPATWPVSVYLGARLLGIPRLPAACSAACAPFVVSLLGIGYEEIAYTFIGFGLWAQMLAMWTLPLAWGTSFQAVHTGRFGRLAPVLVALTVALHFMTGYLAIGAVVLFALLVPSGLPRRLLRAAKVLAVSALLAAWVIVPLVVMRPYASINELLASGPDVNSYGAAKALRWLADGQLLDARRLPVLTVLAGAGLVVAIARWRAQPGLRAAVAAGGLALVLFFGRPTLGPLLVLVPGHEDLFLRRFLMGVQLAGVFLAGVGVAGLAGAGQKALSAVVGRLGRRPPGTGALAAAGIALLVGLLTPAWREVAASDATNARYVAAQQRADATAGRQVAALVAKARRLGEGRIYAGLPSSWGMRLDVGAVPVFRYLAGLDVDEVGFTLRTASLMTNPEAYFDEANPGDYRLFGIRYLLLPAPMAPPVPARLVETEGPFALWTLPGSGIDEVGVADTVAPAIVANRGNLGAATGPFLRSPLPGEGRYPTVAFGARPAAAPTLTGRASEPPGRVDAERVTLAEGRAEATVTLARTAVVVLKASFDPGWTAYVDGRRRPTEMVAPALVGVRVGSGRHVVRFAYVAYGGYPLLLGLAGATLGALVVVPAVTRRARRRRRAIVVGARSTERDLVP